MHIFTKFNNEVILDTDNIEKSTIDLHAELSEKNEKKVIWGQFSKSSKEDNEKENSNSFKQVISEEKQDMLNESIRNGQNCYLFLSPDTDEDSRLYVAKIRNVYNVNDYNLIKLENKEKLVPKYYEHENKKVSLYLEIEGLNKLESSLINSLVIESTDEPVVQNKGQRALVYVKLTEPLKTMLI